MIFDFNEVNEIVDNGSFDVCIAGAGMAGITLARKLAQNGKNVILLEGGGREYSQQSQALYQGGNIGRSYFDHNTSRLRFLGGTSNHWAGWCRPLDAYDFKQHPHIPLSGWPIQKTDLDQYQNEVCDIFEIPHNFEHIEQDEPNEELHQIKFQFSRPPVRFGEKYYKELESADNIALYLHANLVDMKVSPETGSITGFTIRSYDDLKNTIDVTAKHYVLALGGIETPRMLLSARSQLSHGIGNQAGLVGRYFQEHFHVWGGNYIKESTTWPYGDEEVYFAPSEQYAADKQIANFGVRIAVTDSSEEQAPWYRTQAKKIMCSNGLLEDLMRSVSPSFRCSTLEEGAQILVASEQVPNYDSRVLLSDEKDAFGLPKVVLDWKTTDMDKKTIHESMKAIGRYFAKHNYGFIKLSPWLLEAGSEIPPVGESQWLGAGWHHMGTTRMSDSSKTGVVDRNLQVFHHDNLSIASSSVFTTAGHANPSFTILQLTLRLAEHLNKKLS